MRTVGISACLILATALAACDEDPQSVATQTYRGTTAQSTASEPQGAEILWVKKGSVFAITTWGSSSCPPIPTSVKGQADSVVVTFEDSATDVCNADLSPTTSEFNLPDGTRTHQVTIKTTGLDTPASAVLP